MLAGSNAVGDDIYRNTIYKQLWKLNNLSFDTIATGAAH